MNVIVQSKTMEVTEAIREFAETHAQKLLEHDPKVAQVTIYLEHNKKKKNDEFGSSAKFLVDEPGKKVLVEEHAKDLYTAIADAARATSLKLSKLKKKNAARSTAAKRGMVKI